jgi:uncharacterized membrane protein
VTRRSPLVAWCATRAVLLVMLLLPTVGRTRMLHDVRLYERWGNGIADWSSVPFRDFGWEYPPGAALVVTPPAFFGSAYEPVFVAMMLLADLALVLALVRLGRVLGSQAGAYAWVFSTLLLGPLLYTRYDVVSALLAVLAVLALAAGAPLAAGLALGGGVATKLWPALLVVVLPFVRTWRRVVAALAATLAVTVLAVLAAGGAAHGQSTFTRHADRGLQVEAVVATPLVVAQRLGAAVDIAFYPSSGSWDLTGTGVDAALRLSSLLGLAALVGIGFLVWRARRAPEAWLDVAATALLLLAVTGKVFSPQYLIWVFALLAAALCRPGSPLRTPAVLVAVAAAFGQVVYPVYYLDLVLGGGSVVVACLVARNALVLAAAVLAYRQTVKSTAT